MYFFQQVTLVVGEPIDVNRAVEEMKKKDASQVGSNTSSFMHHILKRVHQRNIEKSITLL